MNRPRLLRRAALALRLAAWLVPALALPVAPRPALAAAVEPVTEWTLLADRIGAGAANWHTLAVMHRAMHDAANAALPIYERWEPPAPDEPTGSGAVPQAAVAAAAREVIALLHPPRRAAADRLLREALDRIAPGEAREAGAALGRAVGAAAVARRRGDGYNRRHPFPGSAVPGRWRPTPPDHATSGYTETRPFLFRDLDDADPVPPPALGGEDYLIGVDTTRRLGALVAPARTEEQTGAAIFWAYNLPQRGFIHLAARLLAEHPRPLGVVEEARVMSQVASAMADAAVLVWAEKARYLFWRPITAIREGGFGVSADPEWRPLLDTPPHPDHSAGHAADCHTGAAVLQALFGREVGAITYAAQLGPAEGDGTARDTGADARSGTGAGTGERRRYPSLAAAAEECGRSRIWAGVHFPAAVEEARRLGAAIATRAAVAVPPLR